MRCGACAAAAASCLRDRYAVVDGVLEKGAAQKAYAAAERLVLAAVAERETGKGGSCSNISSGTATGPTASTPSPPAPSAKRSHKPLSALVRPQAGKIQLSIPLAEAIRDDGAYRGALPSALVAVAKALSHVALQYLDALRRAEPPLFSSEALAAMGLPPQPPSPIVASMHGEEGDERPPPLPEDIEAAFVQNVSVLRLWLYGPLSGDNPEDVTVTGGSGSTDGTKQHVEKADAVAVGACRAHYDPGFCTAMLLGSEAGLEINTTDALAEGNGDYASMAAAGGDSSSGSSIDHSPHWRPPTGGNDSSSGDSDCVLLFNNSQLHVATAGAAQHLLHRVRCPPTSDVGGDAARQDAVRDDGAVKDAEAPGAHQGLSYRVNIVVEIRARHAAAIYRLQHPPPPTPPTSLPSIS